MRIVSIDRYYRPIGGKERYALAIEEGLKARGQLVAPFALAEPGNLPTEYSHYFPASIGAESPSFMRRTVASCRRIYNRDAAIALSKLVRAFRPDIAHIHSLHHLSVSVARVLRKAGIPTFATLHDYLWLCPVATLFRDGRPCRDCLSRNYQFAIGHRCSHGLLANSIVAALDAWVTAVSQELNNIWMIAPSQFVRSMFVSAGFAPDRIQHIPHFAPVDSWTAHPPHQSGPIIFVGRLHRLKGAHVLIEAIERLKLPKSQQIVIIGDGPERAALEQQARNCEYGNITFTGFVDHDGVREWYERCIAVVVPSVWYEVFGLSALEPAAVGRPVIASRIGGLPEIVEDGVSGFLVEPNEPDSLANVLDFVLSNPSHVARLGELARGRAEMLFSPAKHYSALMGYYSRVLYGR